MSDQAVSTEPVAAILAAHGTRVRAIGFVLAIAGIALPAFSSSGFGFSESTGIIQIGAPTAGFPLIVLMSLFAPGIMPLRPYARLLDMVAAIAGIALLAFAGFTFFDAQHQIDQTVGSFMPDAVTLKPAYGLIFAGAAVVVVVFQAVRPRHR